MNSYTITIATSDSEVVAQYEVIWNKDYTDENVDNYDLAIEDLPEDMQYAIKNHEEVGATIHR